MNERMLFVGCWKSAAIHERCRLVTWQCPWQCISAASPSDWW